MAKTEPKFKEQIKVPKVGKMKNRLSEEYSRQRDVQTQRVQLQAQCWGNYKGVWVCEHTQDYKIPGQSFSQWDWIVQMHTEQYNKWDLDNYIQVMESL